MAAWWLPALSAIAIAAAHRGHGRPWSAQSVGCGYHATPTPTAWRRTIVVPLLARKGARQRGAGLIEVMVAVVVLAVGLLGIAGLQLASLQNNHSAALRSQAVS